MRTIVQTVLTGMLLVWAGQVSAHATPVSYSPAASSILQQSPETIGIRFSERVDPAASTVTVFAPDGKTLSSTETVDPADPYLLTAPFSATASGTYAVSWQVVSADDGHFTKGAYVFSIRTQSESTTNTSAQFQILHQTDIGEATTIAFELLGQAMVIGTMAMYALVWRRWKKRMIDSKILRKTETKFTLLMIAGIGSLAGGSLSHLLWKIYDLQSNQQIPFERAARMMIGTVAGEYAAASAGVAVIMLIVFFLARRSIAKAASISRGEIMLFALLLVSTFFRARVGHAAASVMLPHFSIGINLIHLLFKDLWIGSLIAFVIAILPLFRLRDMKMNAASLLSLSKLLSIALAVGGVSGAYIVWLHLKSFGNLTNSHWGVQFVLLVAYAFLLLFLRIFQQRKADPAAVHIAQGKASAEDRARYHMIGASLVLEMIVGVAILYASSFLIITTPPLLPPPLFQQSQQSQDATISFGEDPSDTSQFLVSVDPSDVQHLSVTFTNQEKNIGPIVAKTEQRFIGGYVFRKDQLSPPGQWQINVTAQRPQNYDAVSSFTIDYPSDLDAIHTDGEHRTFGFFEMVCILAALAILIAAVLLYRFALQLEKKIQAIPSNNEPAPLLPRDGWVLLVIDVSVVLIIALLGGTHQHGSSMFQQECRTAGGLWHESVPMRNGQVTSPVSVIGCMLGSGQGQFHFVDEREFDYFLRPATTTTGITLDPPVPQPGKPETITVTIRDGSGRAVTDLSLDHDRILHTVIISKDLRTFAHVHAEDSGPVTSAMIQKAQFPVRFTFPRPGKYLVAVDYTERAQFFERDFTVTVPGSPDMPAPSSDLSTAKKFDGYDVRLTPDQSPITAGKITRLRYRIEKDGKPVTDLQPYLSAAMHLSIIRTDLRRFIHTHAEIPQTFLDSILNPRNPAAKHSHIIVPDAFGPDLDAYVLFPLPGTYELFGEVKHQGKVMLTRFMLDVH